MALFSDSPKVFIKQKNLSKNVKMVIEGYTSSLPFKIALAASTNQAVDILNDNDAESLLSIAHRTFCCGSGGSGWDHADHGEVKNTSYVQSWNCSCGQKVSFFKNECPFCNNKKRGEAPKDARWGINAKSHYHYYDKLSDYRLQLIEPLEYDANCREFRFRHWIVEKDSEYLNLYAKKQLESKSKGINFQPLKQDFYFSLPILKYDGVLKVLESKTEFEFTFFDMDNDVPENIPVKYLRKNPKDVIESKNMGKNRGIVERR